MALTDGFIEISPCNAYFNSGVLLDDFIIRTGTSNQRIVLATNPTLPGAITISNNILNITSNVFISGGLGIGTTSLTTGMVTDIVGNIRVTGDINFNSNLYKNGVLFEGGGGAGGWSNNGGFGIFILSNIGVKGPSTANALSVYGRIMMSNFGSNIIGASNNNIGIGTDEPAYDLDVVGDINFTNELYKNGVPFQTSRWSSNANGISVSSNVGIGGVATASSALTVYGTSTLCNLLVTGPNINLSNVVTAFTNFSNLGTASLSNLIVRGTTIHLSNVVTAFTNFSNLGTASLCNLTVTGPIATITGNFSNLGTASLCNLTVTGPIATITGNFSNLGTASLCNLTVTGPIATITGNFSNLGTASLCNLTVTGPNINLSNVVTAFTNFSNLGTATLCNLMVTGPNINLSNVVTSFGNFSNLQTMSLCNVTVLGSITVGGDMTVNGTTTTIDTANVLIEDNILTLNKNQTGTPLINLLSGIEVERGDASNYFFVFEETNDLFKIGLSNGLQAVATRPDNIVDRSIAFWDATNARYSFTSNIVITASSNIGIGTTIPSTRLDVIGSITCSNQFLGSENDTSNLPAYSWSNDANTGIYHPTADMIGFATGGVERMRIDSSGFVGIGVTPTTNIDVSDSRATSLSAIARFMQPNLNTGINTGIACGVATTSANAGFLRFNYNSAGGSTNSISLGTWDATRLLTVTHSGNVGMGTLTPTANLQVSGNTMIGDTAALSNIGLMVADDGIVLSDSAAQSNYQLLLYNGNGANNTEGVGLAFTQYVPTILGTDGAAPPGGAIVFKRTGGYSAGDLLFKTRSGTSLASPCVTRMTITSAGRIGIGTGSPSYDLHVVGQIYATDDILAFSDSRLKTDLIPITQALDKIKKISGYTYRMQNEERKHAGLIAQEVEEVLPEVISNDEKTGYKSIAYGNTVALLLQAIKELDDKVESIKSYLNIT